MAISTKARYGLRMMVVLAEHYGKGPLLLKEIAQNQSLSEKYLSRIVIDLKSAGLVDSFRGANGGYVLTRRPCEITVRQIVWALEDTSPVECVRNSGACERVSSCPTYEVWRVLDQAVYTTLEKITLDDVLAMRQQKCEYTMYYL
jgi:Rrf2 family protein